MIKNSEPLRFIFLGMQGNFTFQVLHSLLQNQLKPEAVILYGKPPTGQFEGLEIEVKQKKSKLVQQLNQHQIPFYVRTTKNLPDTLAKYLAEILLTACWPTILPKEVLQSVSLAAMNIHPSLLPDFAGATPIQDQISCGNHEYGVTLHRMNEQYDSGEIVSQQAIQISPASDIKTIEKACAEQGAILFVEEMKRHYRA